MTYCVGLCTDRGVFIAADSVFSSEFPSASAAAGIDETTVFGEKHGDVGSRPLRYVFEEGLKISVQEATVTGFAGDVNTARALVRAYLDGCALGDDARKAVGSALLSVTPCNEDADVLFAFYEAGKPCLLHVNTVRASIREVHGLVQLGSELSSGQHRWTEQLISSYLELMGRLGSHPLHVERIFAQLVAALQSYGVHDYLVPHGVGGAFVAAWVTSTGARWQGDHLYLIHGETPDFDDPMCATMVRDDVVCLVNNQTSGTKLITYLRPSENQEKVKSRAEAAASKAVDSWDDATFDYFVSINSSKHVVTILEMCRKQHHDLLSLHAPRIENKIGIVWTDAFVQLANKLEGVKDPSPEYMSVRFLPFSEPDEEVRAERDQFAWKQFVEPRGE
ncbi:hypothetical protein WJ58_31085 [Burkholderia ubonensis]|uniref:hypothetical protein n=1 Tax=Burkholderia ubonensis TaxID=101571 RepID=UPI00075DEA80|nr:hypothetical protein [Burkholderia ubonensis]KVM45661.1 hypothetical protein WJ58_31085 [Burkholderia ubonensis]